MTLECQIRIGDADGVEPFDHSQRRCQTDNVYEFKPQATRRAQASVH
jgi:hypothetical protein